MYSCLESIFGNLVLLNNMMMMILLLQKNPGTIRKPEDDKGLEMHQKDLLVDVDRARYISPYVPTMCQDAKDSTYAKDLDFKTVARSKFALTVKSLSARMVSHVWKVIMITKYF